MAYRFRFQTLHRYRDFLLKREQIALGIALRNLEAAVVERTRAEERLGSESQQCEKRQREGMMVPELLACIDRIRALEQHLLKMEREVADLGIKVESARRSVLDRERDLKALTLLDERERESHHHEARKKEQDQIDEFAILGQGRRDDGSGSLR
ncbi:MAG: flagellar export protein FliJ [Syntrophobacteraceae bacterium]|jgi:flagellar export protein FliJ|nr:flagellar export protein FliJ [Syntrophobacteraceae bacterium]